MRRNLDIERTLEGAEQQPDLTMFDVDPDNELEELAIVTYETEPETLASTKRRRGGNRKKLNKQYKPSILGILEPFVSLEKIGRWARNLRFENFCTNMDYGGKMWLFWSSDIEFDQIQVSSQILSGWFSRDGVRVLGSFVYANVLQVHRRELSDQLRDLDCGGDALFVGGDFNIVRSDEEHVGGLLPSTSGKFEFNKAIHDVGLMDIPFDGPKLSWGNGKQGLHRIWARLDRILVNQPFKNQFQEVSLSYLDRTSSDHCPMVLRCMEGEELHGPKPFRFLRMWCTHEGFLPLVKQVWKMKVDGSPMVKISRKLRALKIYLRQWNAEVFGKVQQELGYMEDKLTHLEHALIEHHSQETERELFQCRQKHSAWLQWKEIFWKQKSRIKWPMEGDSNTKFFHASVRNKIKSLRIDHMVLEDGLALHSADEVHEGAIQFFQSLLSVSPVNVVDSEMELLQPVIVATDNVSLCKMPGLEEVKEALWSTPSDSSPGPDGFSASFFVHAWDIVKEDLLEVVKEFFGGRPLTTALGATNIVLVPKVEAPSSFAQFSPSVCAL
ncbi:uncharacterized protein LOC111408437 [Olea europaea var. sylvestris]|uniref:uncharacterized protein LOC111408437 n=1 Tax=Olea europaea var. sylvestris TaxID=158386 RepID=UPI000C1D63DC|nr:uncharacterized protein LOC111408437 [Olea europaea var. sylvestris]